MDPLPGRTTSNRPSSSWRMAAVIDATVLSRRQPNSRANKPMSIVGSRSSRSASSDVFSSYFSNLRIKSGRQVGERRRNSTPSFRMSRSACPARRCPPSHQEHPGLGSHRAGHARDGVIHQVTDMEGSRRPRRFAQEQSRRASPIDTPTHSYDGSRASFIDARTIDDIIDRIELFAPLSAEASGEHWLPSARRCRQACAGALSATTTSSNRKLALATSRGEAGVASTITQHRALPPTDSGLRARNDSLLRNSLHQAVQGSCNSRNLSTEGVRHCGLSNTPKFDRHRPEKNAALVSTLFRYPYFIRPI
ncbi:hypothetical protein ABIB09_007957 [Bradyrhizobium sp. RT3a]